MHSFVVEVETRMGQASVFAMLLMAFPLAVLWALGHAFASGEARASKGRIMLTYFVLLVPVIIGAFVLEALAFTVLNDFAEPSLWAGATLNLLPAFLAGVATYTPLSRRIGSFGHQPGKFWPHLQRCLGLYIVALLLGTHIAMGSSSPGYWMFAQIVIWPLVAVLGGIAADALTRHRRLHSRVIDA